MWLKFEVVSIGEDSDTLADHWQLQCNSRIFLTGSKVLSIVGESVLMEIAFERGERKKRGGYGHALPRFSCIFGKIRILANRRLKFLHESLLLLGSCIANWKPNHSKGNWSVVSLVTVLLKVHRKQLLKSSGTCQWRRGRVIPFQQYSVSAIRK